MVKENKASSCYERAPPFPRQFLEPNYIMLLDTLCQALSYDIIITACEGWPTQPTRYSSGKHDPDADSGQGPVVVYKAFPITMRNPDAEKACCTFGNR